MKISLNSLRYHKNRYNWSDDPAPDGVDALVQRIGAQLGAVEAVEPYGKQFEGVIIAQVVSCQKHPNADKLQVCKLDDGGSVSDISRDTNGHVEVVCGAPNVRQDMLVAWLPPGTTVPSTLGKDPFVLAARDIRGVVSNGMLASSRELGISDNHDGILEIDEALAPGTSFAAAFDLQDEAIIELENKMFTHRPDCFGFMGVARELAGIQGTAFKSPAWYVVQPTFLQPSGNPLPVHIRNELPEKVPRFVVLPMSGVKVKPSPVRLQLTLSRHGIRPINNIVDLTNYYMIMTGQPLHAYDYDKVRGSAAEATLVVRHPGDNEKLTLLNGKEVAPQKDTIMIASAHQLIGIGGVIGGADTEVDENTKNIILECATFDMYSIRRTAMEHGLFTDAVTRFTKGQSPLQNLPVLAKIAEDVASIAGGAAGAVIDDNHVPQEIRERGSIHPAVQVTSDFITARLGSEIAAAEIARLLAFVEFDVQQHGNELMIKAPFWRTDIELPEDIVEEVGRLHGFDKLPVMLPKRIIAPAHRNELLALKSSLRDSLVRAGANEVLTYSFVHGELLTKVGQDLTKAFKLSNALSPDLHYYRLSLTPSLLEKVHANIKAGTEQFALFEIGKTHSKEHLDEAGLPREFHRLALVFAADEKTAEQYKGAPYYQAKHYLAALLKFLGYETTLRFEPLKSADDNQAATYYAPGRAATVKINGTTIGRLGEYRANVRRALKLPDFVAGFEIGLAPLMSQTARRHYQPLSRFPKIQQDICLEVRTELNYHKLYSFIEDHLSTHKPADTETHLSAVDIYQKEPTTKRVTFRLTIVSHVRTLQAEEVNALLDHAAAAAHDTFGAQRI